MRAAAFLLPLLGACSPSSNGPGPAGSGASTGAPVGAPVGLSAGVPTGSPTGEPTPGTNPWDRPVDCTQLLPLPLTSTTYTWVPGHEDFTFSPTGEWVGTSGGHLKGTPWGGPPAILVSGTGDARGTRFLPDGTVVMNTVDSQSLIRADPATGSHWVVRGSLTTPNGIAIGADGMVYVATTGEILRIDPDTGDSEVVAAIANRSFDGLTFSPDYSRLYFNEEIGRINFVDFDADGNPGPAIQAVDLPIAAFSLLDGMAVDACGNLYAVEMGGRLWRVTPDGQIDMALDLPAGAFIPAVNFGPGVGGFGATKIYVQDFIGRMFEAEVGVPGKWEPHQP